MKNKNTSRSLLINEYPKKKESEDTFFLSFSSETLL